MNKKTGKNTQSAYKTENREIKNRTERLKRHVEKHPEDEKAQESLEKGLRRRRKPPLSKTKTWTPEKKHHAHLLRLAGHNGNEALSTKEHHVTK